MQLGRTPRAAKERQFNSLSVLICILLDYCYFYTWNNTKPHMGLLPSICLAFRAGFAVCPEIHFAVAMLPAVPLLRSFKPPLSLCRPVICEVQMSSWKVLSPLIDWTSSFPSVSAGLCGTFNSELTVKLRYSIESRQAVCTDILGALTKVMDISFFGSGDVSRYIGSDCSMSACFFGEGSQQRQL